MSPWWIVLAALVGYPVGRIVETWVGKPGPKRTRGHWTGDQE